jgi:N-acetylglucosaminyldiphosphoundecaprenol N-acetyl-beta-D-mannosaminyltransferase
MRAVSSVEILGVRVDDATYGDLLDRVDAFVASGEPHQVITVNAEMLVSARHDQELTMALEDSDLNVADSVGVILAARLLGQPLQERVTGSDGIHWLAAHSALNGYRLYLLGAAPGVAELVAERLSVANPNLVIAGTYAGSPSLEEEEDIIERIGAANPDLLLVAYGVPAEEKWIARNRFRLRVPVMVGVGGAFDFVAGMTQRAPGWMRRCGLEWLHRLLREPWRWRRQLALPKFLILVLKQKLETMVRSRKVVSP